MNVSGNQKFQFSNSKVQPKLMFNNQHFIYFMNLKKMGSPTRATLTNANFEFAFCELRKKIEVSLRPIFKNLHFESKDDLKNSLFQFGFHC